MFTIIQDKNSGYGVVKLVLDTEADLATLPTHYTPGSRAIVLENAKIYMLSNEKKWTYVKTSDGSGGGNTPDIPSTDEIIYDGGSF